MNTREYLKNIVTLEGTLYTLKKSIGYLEYSKKDLGIKYDYTVPEYNPDVEYDVSGVYLVTAIMDFFIGGPIGLIAGLITKSFLIFMGCIIIVGIILFFHNKSEREHHNRSLLIDYEHKKEEYENLISEDKLRVEKELQKKRNIDIQISILKNKYNETSTTLQKLYNMNILYPKYKNFIAAATFYEYFDSGRCRTLEGHEGAYNIFENELRLNAILGKLDDILNHLEEIRSSQYAIYNAISQGNKTANAIYQNSVKIADTMNTIEDNTALAAYNSAISAKNTEILKFIAVYDHTR